MTHDYNVILNDVVLIKWKKNYVLIFKTSLWKIWQNIYLSWFQLLFIIIKIINNLQGGIFGEKM
jgi:hypothetical protein